MQSLVDPMPNEVVPGVKTSPVSLDQHSPSRIMRLKGWKRMTTMKAGSGTETMKAKHKTRAALKPLPIE
jgi:hypothetical protein